MKKSIRKITAAVLALIMLMLVSVSAYCDGETVDFDRTGSITVALQENEDSKPLSGLNFTIYKIADVTNENHQLHYVLTEDFADCGVSLDDLQADDMAEHLAVYAKDHSITGSDRKTDGNSLTFTDLELGLYLLVQKEAVKGYYLASPFVVSVPMTDTDGTAWVYDISTSPKVEVKPEPAPGTKSLTVLKKWANAGTNIPAYVEVSLLKDGKVEQTVKLDNENEWTYTWKKLDNGYQWSVVEKDVPKGFSVSYSVSGNTCVITNTAGKDVPVYPVTLTVKKIWDDNGKNRPAYVTMQLYENGTARDTVTLNDANHWVHTWKNLSAKSTWDVKEVNTPNGYKAFYDRVGNLIKVTNSVSLIQTGQLKWPIPIFAGSGVLLFALGWAIVCLKKKNEDK